MSKPIPPRMGSPRSTCVDVFFRLLGAGITGLGGRTPAERRQSWAIPFELEPPYGRKPARLGAPPRGARILPASVPIGPGKRRCISQPGLVLQTHRTTFARHPGI